MSRQRPTELLSEETRGILLRESAAERVIDGAPLGGTRTSAGHVGAGADDAEDLTDVRRQVAAALDRLDVAIEKVLEDRKQAEADANRWITIVGLIVVLLVVASAIAPFFNIEPKGGVLSAVFSSLSVAALLFMLYSPVQKRLSIADDRSNLVLMSTAYRLRFAAARTYSDYADLARELTEALRITRQDGSP